MWYNGSTVKEFILLGFTNVREVQLVLAILFFFVYIITLLGNFGIAVIIWIDRRLHSPMYFFLCNLAFLDICYSSVITPKMLYNSLSGTKAISYVGCVLQMYLFAAFATTECLILAFMAYDRYVAICKPMLYPVIMTPKRCITLVVLAYVGGFLQSLIHTCFTFRLSFCRTNEINHFFCDIPPLLKISCSDTKMNEIMLFSFCGCNEGLSGLAILVSYVCIVSATLQVRSSQGRRKAFSTCASHLVAVSLYYGALFFMYLRPAASYSLDRDRIVSLIYTIAIPMVNPLIYSLRNTAVKEALRKNLRICR